MILQGTMAYNRANRAQHRQSNAASSDKPRHNGFALRDKETGGAKKRLADGRWQATMERKCRRSPRDKGKKRRTEKKRDKTANSKQCRPSAPNAQMGTSVVLHEATNPIPGRQTREEEERRQVEGKEETTEREEQTGKPAVHAGWKEARSLCAVVLRRRAGPSTDHSLPASTALAGAVHFFSRSPSLPPPNLPGASCFPS